MYDPFRRNKDDDEIEDQVDDNSSENTTSDEDMSTEYIIGKDIEKQYKLPAIIKIRDPVPGEVNIWKRRAFPKAARIHKKREDTDPHRYILSELMLYTAFTDEKELWPNNESKCRKLYEKRKEEIEYTKKHLR